jgi:hypothetical protein
MYSSSGAWYGLGAGCLICPRGAVHTRLSCIPRKGCAPGSGGLCRPLAQQGDNAVKDGYGDDEDAYERLVCVLHFQMDF